MVSEIFDLRLEVFDAVVWRVVNLLNSAVFTELVCLREMVAVLLPVMCCEQVERSVGFLVLATIKLALELVLLVMFVHVLQKLIVAHLCFAFGNLRSYCSFAFEPSEYQI